MEQMMKELEGMMDTGEFEDMFGGLMNQLASKDLLYEPMKDLANKVTMNVTKCHQPIDNLLFLVS